MASKQPGRYNRDLSSTLDKWQSDSLKKITSFFNWRDDSENENSDESGGKHIELSETEGLEADFDASLTLGSSSLDAPSLPRQSTDTPSSSPRRTRMRKGTTNSRDKLASWADSQRVQHHTLEGVQLRDMARGAGGHSRNHSASTQCSSEAENSDSRRFLSDVDTDGEGAAPAEVHPKRKIRLYRLRAKSHTAAAPADLSTDLGRLRSGSRDGGNMSTSKMPFPMLRSQSSQSTTNLAKSLEPNAPMILDQPRRKTEGEVCVPSTLSAEPVLGNRQLADNEIKLPPKDHENDTPAEYALTARASNLGSHLCALLAEKSEPFFYETLLKVVKDFAFNGDALDMAVRKFLMFMHLPQEAQQIERMLQAFSHVYMQQNPGIFASEDQVYFVVYSMVILHTDYFNKNVRHKMSKSDYVRSALVGNIPTEIFEYFYDNITCMEFINLEDIDRRHSSTSTGSRNTSELHSLESSNSLGTSSNHSKRNAPFNWGKDLVDPYPFIIEGTTASLNPKLESILKRDDPYSTILLDTPQQFEALRCKCEHGPRIKLTSARSRAEAYSDVKEAMSELSAQESMTLTSPGAVDIRVLKLGVFMRRDSTKKIYSSKNVWRRWGAILTESQLYLFKSPSVVQALCEEAEVDGSIVLPTGERMTATYVLSTKDLAAFVPATQDPNQEHSFILARGNGACNYFALNTIETLHEWIFAINFAATFSTYHVGPALDIPDRAQLTRTKALEEKLSLVADKLQDVKHKIEIFQNNCKHFEMLTPTQQRTREALVAAANNYSSKCAASWLEYARLRCYQNILKMDRCVTEERLARAVGEHGESSQPGEPGEPVEPETVSSHFSQSPQSLQEASRPRLGLDTTAPVHEDTVESPLLSAFGFDLFKHGRPTQATRTVGTPNSGTGKLTDKSLSDEDNDERRDDSQELCPCIGSDDDEQVSPAGPNGFISGATPFEPFDHHKTNFDYPFFFNPFERLSNAIFSENPFVPATPQLPSPSDILVAPTPTTLLEVTTLPINDDLPMPFPPAGNTLAAASPKFSSAVPGKFDGAQEAPQRCSSANVRAAAGDTLVSTCTSESSSTAFYHDA